MKDKPRLIEVAFPLKQASLDSVHEKNVRHGHISTLHIWPARRPLAACRAALIATLLPDPGNDKEREKILEKLAGKVVEKVDAQTGKKTYETEGGILHWGRESGPDLQWFRDKIREAYGDRAPKVLDPFAGGGAIPLEAMRLGCETTAIDINPVAWFLLKCTLEYPQKLAGQKRPLPDFALRDPEFMEAFFKATGKKTTRKQLETRMKMYQMELFDAPEADFAWHVRAWAWWVLKQARKELAPFYPTYAQYQPLVQGVRPYEHRPLRLVQLDEQGVANVDQLNSDSDAQYLNDPQNPRWIAKPTVAYLWARTVKCKNCRATIPILKTRWLCKKREKRIILTMEVDTDRTGVIFGIEYNVPEKGGNTAQKNEHDRKLGAGTMTRSGVKCPCCPAIMTRKDLQLEGTNGRLGLVMTTVIVDGLKTKEYRLPTDHERETAVAIENELGSVFDQLPHGKPTERININAKGDTWCVLYGHDEFWKVFTSRQLIALSTFALASRKAIDAMHSYAYSAEWKEAVLGYLYCTLSRLADRNSQMCTWQVGSDKIGHTFTRYVLPFTWDFVEVMPWADSSGGFGQAAEWVAKYVAHANDASAGQPCPTVKRQSAITQKISNIDVIITDPPYYEAIGYAVIMDFFSVWLRRVIEGKIPEAESFPSPNQPKWDHEECDGELVDDSCRFGGDKNVARQAYEDGMARAFSCAHTSLTDNGAMVVVFANKDPEAWATLVSALIRAGFVVNSSWPIMTERTSRMRSMASSALSSSVWLVCKKRPAAAKPGWDNLVLEEMRQRITERLRAFWDARINGPDFVWAATGPAMEAYSKHPAVKKANKPGELMTVSEFLQHVRRMVVDFVVGRVLSQNGDAEAVSGLDDVTTYYLLHRYDFGLEDAPSGACIMYAISCGLSDKALQDQWDVIHSKGGGASGDDLLEATESDEEDDDAGTNSGGKVKLVPWSQRKKKNLGYLAPGGRPVPLIDQVHRLMHLWKAGDQVKVNEYLDEFALRNNKLFHQLLQALIELSPRGKDERQILESLSNHVVGRGEKHEDTIVGTTEIY